MDAISLTNDAVRAMVGDLAVTVDAMHKHVAHRVQAVRAASRRLESKGVLPNFAVGDCVLMARVRPPGKTSNMMSTRTGPWRVTNASSPHVYQVQDIVSGKVTNAHVVRLKFCKNSSIGTAAYVQEAFQYLFNQGEFHIEALLVSYVPLMGPTSPSYIGSDFRNPRSRGSRQLLCTVTHLPTSYKN